MLIKLELFGLSHAGLESCGPQEVTPADRIYNDNGPVLVTAGLLLSFQIEDMYVKQSGN